MKLKIALDNIMYKKITYYLCLCPLKVYCKYNKYFYVIWSKLEIGNTDTTWGKNLAM